MTRPQRPAPADAGPKVSLLGALLQCTRVKNQQLFGRVLLTFDPAYRDDPVFLLWVRGEIARLSRMEPGTPEERAVVEAVSQGFLEGEARWRDMPARLTRHVRVHLVDIRLDEALAPSGVLLGDSGPLLLPCQADPRCRGMAELVRFTVEDMERLEDLPAQRLAERGGKKVMVVRVQANAALYAPGPEPSLPALVLLCFDKETEQGLAELEELASRLFELKTQSPRDAGEKEAREAIVNNEDQAVLYRRVRLPSRFTDGRVVYAADLWIRRRCLPKGFIKDERRLACIAEPGDEGAIEMLPREGPSPKKSAAPRRGEEAAAVEVGPLEGTEPGQGRKSNKKLGIGLVIAGGLALLAGLALLLLGGLGR
jgi:hypothetical protein